MLSSLLSKFLASLLVSVLCGSIITVVLANTLLSPHYIENRLTAINGYNRLSSGLSSEVSHQAGLANNPQVTAKIQTILTPTVVKLKLNTALDQLQGYYQGKTPAPVIDLSDLAAQAQAAGIPLGQDSSLTQPITIGGNHTQAKNITKSFEHVRVTTILSSIVLVGLLLAVSWERHRYAVLPDVLISVGVLMGLVALVLNLGPSLVDHYVKLSTTSNAFASLGRDLAESIARDLARRFGIIAVVCVVIGVVARILVSRFQRKPIPKLAPNRLTPKSATI